MLRIRGKINWGITWLAMTMLKRSLRYRISGENAYWLQPVQTSNILLFNRIDFILDTCNGKKILHVGFSDYPFTIKKINDGTLLHLQLQKITCGLLGLDNDKNTIEQYRQITNNNDVVYGDITHQYPLQTISFNPDIILLSEVMEHLAAPYKAVDILFDSFAHGTKILVTVPNYMALDSIASSIHKTEAIHPHHHWYFSPFTLCKLFDDKRFKLEQVHFGMYYLQNTKINAVLKQYPFNGDCIMAIFSISKTALYD